mmetsp:Transcript_59033/g.129614  ORF Transcript_59033/g.129614 Transcript_59033/m.129614 type:complete len:115 (-) Transcript_59033:158-502(-)
MAINGTKQRDRDSERKRQERWEETGRIEIIIASGGAGTCSIDVARSEGGLRCNEHKSRATHQLMNDEGMLGEARRKEVGGVSSVAGRLSLLPSVAISPVPSQTLSGEPGFSAQR